MWSIQLQGSLVKQDSFSVVLTMVREETLVDSPRLDKLKLGS